MDDTAVGTTPEIRGGHWLDAERVRVYSWMLVVIFGLGAVAWTLLSLPGLVDPRGKPVGYDFIAFWSAARLALEGRPEAAYDWTAIAEAHRLAVPALRDVVFAWHYPPTFLLTVLPLGLFPYAAALGVFTLAGVALWSGLVRRVAADPRAWIVAASAPAGLINLLDGQNGFLTASLAGFALIQLARRPAVAGVLIGLLAIKPHLAVLFPLALLADRQWRAIAAAAATAALFVAISVAAFGWGTLTAFLHDLPLGRELIDAGSVPWGAMPSPYVFALSLGAAPSLAAMLQGVAALAAAISVYRAWRNPAAPFEARAATLLAGAMLVSPFLFTYDLTWAALAAGWLALLGLRTGFRRFEREILLFCWLAPLAMSPVHALTAVQLGCPALVMLLILAVRRAAPPSNGERALLRRVLDAFREAAWLTPERAMRWGIGFVLMSLGLLALHVATHTAAGLTDAAGEPLGGDFINYWSGARLATQGQTSLAYDHRWFHAFEQATLGPGSSFKIYGYPPIAMLLSLPLAPFGFVAALILWTLAGAALCFALLRRLVGWRAAAVAVVGAPAAFLNIQTGQNGYFTAALLAGGLMLIERRPAVAGICLGCLAYKPQLALLLPLALAAGGTWRAFAAAAATVAALTLASLVLFGPATWAGFFDQMVLQRQLLEYGTSFWHRMPTVFAAARVLGAPIALSYLAQLVSGAAAALAVVAVWRSPPPTELKAAALVLAAFLATPYAWDYDMVALIFAAAWLAREATRRGFLPWERAMLALQLLAPLLQMVTTKFAGLQLGPVVLWATLLLVVRRAQAYAARQPDARPGRELPVRRDSVAV